jgi:choline kinase
MRGIVLAAGRGSRMGSATQDQPKCLTALFGKTLLDWQLEALRGAGIQEIAVVRGYRGTLLTRQGIHSFENPRWADTNRVMSLACASTWLASDVCVVSYSDIVYPASTVQLLGQADGDIAITYSLGWRRLWEARFGDPLADAETFRVDGSGRLLEIGARPTTLDEVQGQYMGLLRFTPRGWAHVREVLASLDSLAQDRLDMTSLLGHLLRRGCEIAAVPTADNWYEVDSQSDLELYQSMAQRRGGLFLP